MKSRAKHTDILWNILTVLVLLAIAAMAVYFVFIYLYPTSPLNTYPPPTEAVAMVLPTNPPATDTLTPFTRTPVRIASVTRTPTLTKTVTVILTPSYTPVTPTLTPTITETFTPEITDTAQPYSAFPFMLQGSPVLMSGDGSVFPTNHGCNWMGVAGRVIDLQGAPVANVNVQLLGSLDGKYINLTSLTGTARDYGESGYEFTIANKTMDSKKSLSVYLFDQSQIQISEKVTFDTSSDCSKNLVLINFKQARVR